MGNKSSKQDQSTSTTSSLSTANTKSQPTRTISMDRKNDTKCEALSILSIQEALHYINDKIMKNDTLADEIIDIIITYIYNSNTIKPGMVLFGRCTQGGDHYQYNLIFLLTKMKNIKIHSKVSYFYESFDFDSIFVWSALDDSVSIGSGRMELVENGMFNEYKVIATEHKYHKHTIGRQLGFNCKYNLTLKLPDNEECSWSNWDEYMNRISLLGRWDWPYNSLDNTASGNVYIYRTTKWDHQLKVKQYTKIPQLHMTPKIKDQTTIETAVEEIEQIVNHVTLNDVDEK